MARKNQIDETADETDAANSLDALMDADYANLPAVMETIPTGTWKLRAKNGFYKEASGDQKAKAGIFLIPVEPYSDVDPEALAEAGEGYDFTNNQIVFSRNLENLRDLVQFLDVVKAFGVDMADYTPRTAIKQGVKGKEVVASIGTRTYTGRMGQVTENTVSNFVAVDGYSETSDEQG
jgi:hypothetical protein